MKANPQTIWFGQSKKYVFWGCGVWGPLGAVLSGAAVSLFVFQANLAQDEGRARLMIQGPLWISVFKKEQLLPEQGNKGPLPEMELEGDLAANWVVAEGGSTKYIYLGSFLGTEAGLSFFPELPRGRGTAWVWGFSGAPDCALRVTERKGQAIVCAYVPNSSLVNFFGVLW